MLRTLQTFNFKLARRFGLQPDDRSQLQRRMAMKFLPRLDRVSRARRSPTAIGDGKVTPHAATFTDTSKHSPT
jgi:hypothetical protein